jgi:uncharacterized protein YqeY
VAPEVTKDRIQADLADALKGGDRRKVSTLRMLMAAVKNREIELRKPLDGAELCAVITSGVKKRRESIEEFKKGGREDLVKAETEEADILQAYLPPPLTEQELAVMVDEAVRESGASGPRDMGVVMKLVMPRVAGRADGGLVGKMVKARLA